MVSLNELENYREGNRIEAKSSSGGLPKNLWDTYSAFANTGGGIILLGVDERKDKSLHAVGLENPEKLVTEIWNAVNNPQKVSVSILLDKHVRIETVDGKRIIVIEVPRADRGLRPVYINHNPMSGTFRRNGEGDYRCPPEIVKAMLRDSGEKTQDMLVLGKMSLNVFDYESLHRFRNRMKDTRPGHVWSDLEDVEFLQKLGAIGIGEDERLHPTAAGLLMFGFEHEILHEYPQYFLDYQEHYDPGVRWTDRFTSSSGEWSGNLFDFYFKAFNKLAQNPKIKVPFKMEGIIRIDDTPVHKALREALANCITNADYYGERGVVIRNNVNDLVFENPGGFRVTIGEALSGGVSSPRNAVILKMFNLLDIGERTGSGIPLIFKSWNEEGYHAPEYTEQLAPARTILSLPIFTEPNEKAATRSGDNGKSAIKSGDNESQTKKSAIKSGDNEPQTKKSATRSGDNEPQTKKAAIKSGDNGKSAIKSGDNAPQAKGDAKKQMIIAHLAEHGSAKSETLSLLIGVKSSQTKVYLKKLIAEGVVVAEGENRNRTYRLKP